MRDEEEARRLENVIGAKRYWALDPEGLKVGETYAKCMTGHDLMELYSPGVKWLAIDELATLGRDRRLLLLCKV